MLKPTHKVLDKKVTVFIRLKPYKSEESLRILESVRTIDVAVASDTTILELKALICSTVQDSGSIAEVDKDVYLKPEQIGEITDVREICSYKDSAIVLSLREKNPWPPHGEMQVIFKAQPVEALESDTECRRSTSEDNGGLFE